MDDDSLRSLLAGGRLSGAQRERVLAGALRRSQRRPWRVVGALALVLPAAAAVAFFVRGGAENGSEAGHLVPKGSPAPLLSARCPGRASGTCRTGDRLIFEVAAAKKPGFFAAYAECGARERIWYFPTASGALPQVATGDGTAVIDQAARIGAEHGVGRCALHLFLLPEPASRASVLAFGQGAADGTKADVVIEVEH